MIDKQIYLNVIELVIILIIMCGMYVIAKKLKDKCEESNLSETEANKYKTAIIIITSSFIVLTVVASIIAARVTATMLIIR